MSPRRLIVFATGVLLLSSACTSTPPPRVLPVPPAATVAPRQGDVTVEVSDRVLTDRLNDRLEGLEVGDTPFGPATLGRLQTRASDGELTTSGSAEVGGRSFPVSLTGRVDVRAGRLLVEVTGAHAAGLRLPDQARDGAQQVIQEQLNRELDRLGIQVSSATIADGKIILTGRRA